MNENNADTYSDDTIRCDDHGVTIRRYYLWGAKQIPYRSIKSIQRLPLTGVNKLRKWRIWGSGDFVHWWNLDPHRPKKTLALVLDIGKRIRPTITPDNPVAVEHLITSHSFHD